MTTPPDEGLQAERTALSWRRTALSLSVGCLLVTRLVAEPLGPVGASLGLVAAACGFAAFTVAESRYRTARKSLAPEGPSATRPRPPIAFVGAATALISALALGYVMARI